MAGCRFRVRGSGISVFSPLQKTSGPTLLTTTQAAFWQQRIHSEFGSALLLERRMARANSIYAQPRTADRQPSKAGMPPTTLSAQLARLKSSKSQEQALRNVRLQTGSWPTLKRYPNVDDVLSLARAASPPCSPQRPPPWR
ncbi:MAG: hypothetical protein SGPRY_004133 [Prymnesium sp.]